MVTGDLAQTKKIINAFYPGHTNAVSWLHRRRVAAVVILLVDAARGDASVEWMPVPPFNGRCVFSLRPQEPASS
ncbi:protein of unknown function [Paraburkholderia kururiensis]